MRVAVVGGGIGGLAAGLSWCESELTLKYEAIRKPRTTRTQLLGRRNGEIFHLADGPEQHDRDESLRSLQGAASHGLNEWLFGHDAEASATGSD